jgi:tetratricopeptide (TPR) repeat protein
VFLLAAVLKLVYVHERVGLPDVDHPTLDSRFHDQWARGIAFGQWTPDLERIRTEAYFRAPLYPYFLAAVYRWLGDGPILLFTIQALLGALTTAVMYSFCRATVGPAAAWVAVALCIGYWPFTYHEAERMLPALSLPLDMLLLAVLVVAGRTGKYSYTCLAGVVAGLSAITRPSVLIVLPLGMLWLFLRVRVNTWRHVTLLALATMVVILPVTLRNAVVGRDFVPIAWQGGVNFFIGNNAESNGVIAVIPGARADWWGGFEDTRRMAEAEAGHPLKPSQISRYWYKKGFRFLKDDPGTAIQLYLRKLRLLIGNAEPSNERQLYFRREQSSVLQFLFVNFAFIISTAVIGIAAICRSQAPKHAKLDHLLPLYFAVPYAAGILLFFVTSRFRLPVVLFLIPLSAGGCMALFNWLRTRNWRPAITLSLIATTLFSVSMQNPYAVGAVSDARGYYNLGLDYFRERDYAAALSALNRSIEADAGFAPSWAARGRIHNLLGNPYLAIKDLEQACVLDPSLSASFYWLGVAYQKIGEHSRAESVYRRSIALDSTGVEVFTNLADVYFRQRRLDDARMALEHALREDSTYVNAIYGLGYYYEAAGQRQKAAALYERALPFPPARLGLERLRRPE